MKTALTIAGSDSSGGAGIQEDLKVFSAFGVHGTCAITAVTAQNTKGVRKIEFLSPGIVSEQMDSVLCDFKTGAAKTGMLGTAEIIGIIYKKLREYGVENIVVDPVMVSTSGVDLLELSSSRTLENLRKLIKISKLATPNVHEAEVLSGIEIKNHGGMERAAKKIGNCIITGGDFGINEDSGYVVDLLFFDDEFMVFRNKKNNSVIHGTGCTFSAAITAGLAEGSDLLTAIKKAESFTSDLIEHNLPAGISGNLNILNPNILLERFRVKENVGKAVEKLVSGKNTYKLAPQVGINIAMALFNAKKLDDVAGVSGRIVRAGEKIVPAGEIEFGCSSHVGRIVLTAMSINPEKRAAVNIKFSDEILKICSELNLTISCFERSKQPDDTKTMEWGTKTAIESSPVFPDIIYDKGGFGKEAMIRILGEDALAVSDCAIKISELI